MTKELYSRLGLTETASEKEIEEAFRTLATQCGPDSGRDDRDSALRYAGIEEAYRVLSDMDSRAAYDITGEIRRSKSGVSGIKGRRGSGKCAAASPLIRAREILNSVFLVGAAVTTILFILYLTGSSPMPFYIVCGISLCIKLAEYLLRLIQ